VGVEAAPRVAPLALFNPFSRKMDEEDVVLGGEYDA
jgi:predicted methyltransferase